MRDRLTVSTLFKNAHKPHVVYCWEAHCDPEPEFRAAVLENKLSGLIFKEVWSE